MPRIGNGFQSVLSNEQLTKSFTRILRYYLRKNSSFITQAWEDIIRTRVYGGNTPVCYLRTEALLLGFDVEQFINSFKIRVDESGFNIDLNYTFDTSRRGGTRSPVMSRHLSKRGDTPIDKIMVDVRSSTGQSRAVSLPMFMKTHRLRLNSDWEPKLMSNAVLAGKLVGSFRPPKDNSSSYFAAYFTAGPNSKGNPEVYKRGGANPKGASTKRDADKSTIIPDFLRKLGLNPASGTTPPGGNTDWIILVDSFSEVANVGFLPAPSPMQCEVGGILQACLRTYELIQRGRPVMHTKKWQWQGKAGTTTRLADAVRETRAFRRWQSTFWGAQHKLEILERKDSEFTRLHGGQVEVTGLAPELISEAQEFVTELHQKGLLVGLRDGDLEAEVMSLVPSKLKSAVNKALDARDSMRNSLTEGDRYVAELNAGLADAGLGGEDVTSERKDHGYMDMSPRDRMDTAKGDLWMSGGKKLYLTFKDGEAMDQGMKSFPEQRLELKLTYVPPSEPGGQREDGSWILESIGGGSGEFD